MTDKQIADLFISLAQIPSPSGYEAKVASFVKSYLDKQGWLTWQEKSGNKNASNADNVYAYLEVNKKAETLAFSAHMDTVQKEGDQVEVVFKNDQFKSKGNTILGADDKAGITSLLAFASQVDKTKLKHNILLFFPTREESGIMGSSLFNPKKVTKIKYFFNADAGGVPGTFIYRSLGYKNFKLIVNGVSAHAAKDYEKGVDAVVAASQIITLLPIGKNTSKGFTLNVGIINGGSSTNVVCDKVELSGEYRAFSNKNIKLIEETIKKVVKKVESQSGAKVDVLFDEKSYIPPFLGDLKSPLVNFCKKVSSSLKITPNFSESYSTSDACFYSHMGYPTISICRGGSKAHSNEETLEFKHLKTTINLLENIVYAA